MGIKEWSHGWLAVIRGCVAAKRMIPLHVPSLAPTLGSGSCGLSCVPSSAQTAIVIALLS